MKVNKHLTYITPHKPGVRFGGRPYFFYSANPLKYGKKTVIDRPPESFGRPDRHFSALRFLKTFLMPSVANQTAAAPMQNDTT